MGSIRSLLYMKCTEHYASISADDKFRSSLRQLVMKNAYLSTFSRNTYLWILVAVYVFLLQRFSMKVLFHTILLPDRFLIRCRSRYGFTLWSCYFFVFNLPSLRQWEWVLRYSEIRKLFRGGNPTDDLKLSNERNWHDAIFVALPFTKVFLRLIII